MEKKKANVLEKLAVAYFSYLAKTFPVMCASDEFDCFPRAQAARHYYHRLDNLEAQRIEACLDRLKIFKKELSAIPSPQDDLEHHIDMALLNTSIQSVAMELETRASWRHNPLLYLKIAGIGLDHALTRPATYRSEREQRFSQRLLSVPRLMGQAIKNLDTIPSAYHLAALSMADDFKVYLHQVFQNFPSSDRPSEARSFLKGRESALKSLEVFRKFLTSTQPVPDDSFSGMSPLKTILKERYLCLRSPDDIMAIARQEWHDNLALLNTLQKTISPHTSWKQLYHAYNPSEQSRQSVLACYQEEIDKLRAFFKEHGFRHLLQQSSLVLQPTPTYLRSVRGSASFSSALCATPDESDFFFITTQHSEIRSKQGADQLTKRLHREYRFLAAHETVPGHHLLDTARRSIENPIRRQIESPLFYEGWATYAETLLSEYGYMATPIEQLIACKRRLWRSARCQIDVGLNTGHLTKRNAIELLVKAGFSKEEARIQAQRYHLNPGYQLCYTLGLYELLTLRNRYGNQLGLDLLHDRILKAGQLPFSLLAEYLKKST